jgi:hypothetical protein
MSPDLRDDAARALVDQLAAAGVQASLSPLWSRPRAAVGRAA